MSLSDLPPELILHVFESFDKFSHAAALSQTSRHLYTMWRYDLTSICDAILPRVIECYDQAHQFRDAQSGSFIVARHSSVEGRAEGEANAEAKIAVSRACLLFESHEYSYAIMEVFRIQVSFIRRKMPRVLSDSDFDDYVTTFEQLEPRTRTHFLQGHYRARSIMHLVGKNRAKIHHVLASMSLLDFFRMLEIAEWMTYRDWDSKEWQSLSEEGCRFLTYLEIDLVKISGVARPMDEFRALGPSCPLILDEDCMRDNADKAKRVALANLLPLIPDNSTLDAHNDLVVPHWLQKAIA